MKTSSGKLQKQYYILIDESGTLPDPRDTYIVIAAVGLEDIKEGKHVVSKVLQSLRERKVRIAELKFYYAGEQTKRRMLSGIILAGFQVFALIVDKQERKISDTPENFALLISELIREVSLWRSKQEFSILIDRHFHKRKDEDKFNRLLREYVSKNIRYEIQHVNSQQNFVVNLADFAAGAILTKYSKDTFLFSDIIKKNIVAEKIVSWPELKKKQIK